MADGVLCLLTVLEFDEGEASLFTRWDMSRGMLLRIVITRNVHVVDVAVLGENVLNLRTTAVSQKQHAYSTTSRKPRTINEQ